MVRRNRNRRALRSTLAVFGGAALLTGVVGSPASAEIAVNGTPSAGVYQQATGTETDNIDNLVYDIEQIGDVIYVSGKFLETRPSSDEAATPAAFLAAFNATTGAHISSFQPQIEGPVYALQASPDGSRLIIGGEFVDVGGDGAARGLAAVNPATGALDPTWRAPLTTDLNSRAIVFDMVVTTDSLYAVGRFDTISAGTPTEHRTQRVLKVDLLTGTADNAFSVTSAGGSIRSVALSPDGSRVYVGGNHSSANGDPDEGYFTVLDAATGSTIPDALNWNSNGLAGGFPNVYAVAAVNNLVFFPGANNRLLVFDTDTGEEIARHETDGDYQRLAVVGDRVYAGGHFYEYHEDQDDVRTDHTRIVAYSSTTGHFIPSFNPEVSAEQSGVWAIHGSTDGCLWLGGDLSSMGQPGGGNRTLGGFARFCEDVGDGGPGADVTPPTAPSQLIQTRAENHKIVIKYSAAFDLNGISHYEVRRNGVLIDTEPGGSSNEWYVDRDLDSGTTYHYEVVAIDPAGNVGPAITLAAATTGQPPDDPDDGLAAPTGLRSTRQTRERIVLNWQSVSGTDHYVIQIDEGAGFVDLGQKSSRWYTHSGLSAGTTYTYRVVAVDAAGVRGTPSDPLSVTTLP